MGHIKREKSRSGIYHVVLRGINRQEIFEEEQDCKMFLTAIRKTKEKMNFSLHACCLMGNHIHLLIMEQPNEAEISEIMQYMESIFAMWYNKKYKRTGYVFQSRFTSVAVEDIDYYRTVFRYIHMNPRKAGMEDQLGHYRWNSIIVYCIQIPSFQNDVAARKRVLNDWCPNGIELIDCQLPLLVFKTCEELVEFCSRENNDLCIDSENLGRKDSLDRKARRIIEEISGCRSVADFQALNKIEKERYIAEIYKRGVRKSSIYRLCGVSERRVRHALAKYEHTVNKT